MNDKLVILFTGIFIGIMAAFFLPLRPKRGSVTPPEPKFPRPEPPPRMSTPITKYWCTICGYTYREEVAKDGLTCPRCQNGMLWQKEQVSYDD